MATIEHVQCDACKRTWPRVQDGVRMQWERQFTLSWSVEFGMGASDGGTTTRELCDTCAGRASRILSAVERWLDGDGEALAGLMEGERERKEAGGDE